MDKLIYKYYRVNEYLFDVLISNQLYFSSIDQFNDPYDCHFAVKGLPTIEDYRKFWEQHSDNVDDYRHHLETFEKSAEGAMKPLLKAIREFLAYYGICCFAESKEELLMWSHYANSHYGICIGFDFAQMTKSFPQFDKVEYKSEPHLFDITDMSSSMAKSILTKSKNWEYENEIRFLMERSKSCGFDMTAVREVNFGHKCASRHVINIIHLMQKLGYKNCSFFRATIHESDYSLTFPSIDFRTIKEEVLKQSEEIRFTTTVHMPKL